MTLIIAVTGRETIWMLADRRLTYRGRPPRDNARKLMTLESLGDIAILGYAGLGATNRGTEPADWMSAVVRGRNVPLEKSLGFIADAMRREFPKHLRRFPLGVAAGHNIVVPAFVDGQVRLYSIDIALDNARQQLAFRYTRHVAQAKPSAAARTPRLALAGSGALSLERDRSWIRNLLRLVRATEKRLVSPLAVADYLASVNLMSSRSTRDGSVGESCVVVWRHNKAGVHKGGGGHQWYEGSHRTDSGADIPTIANGMDVSAIARIVMPHMLRQMAEARSDGGADKFDMAQVNAELAQLPEQPDERLE